MFIHRQKHIKHQIKQKQRQKILTYLPLPKRRETCDKTPYTTFHTFRNQIFNFNNNNKRFRYEIHTIEYNVYKEVTYRYELTNLHV